MDNTDVLPSSGQLNLSAIGELYGVSRSNIMMSRLYANGFYGVGNSGSPNVPSSGLIKFTDFYSAKRRSDTITSHPPILSANSMVIDGLTYTAFANSSYSSGVLPFRAFDGSYTTEWMHGDNVYDGTTGIVNSPGSVLAEGYMGSFVGITMPINVYPVSWELIGNMLSFRLYGQRRNNPGVWERLDEKTDTNVQPTTQPTIFPIPQAAQGTPYFRFAIATNKVVPNGFGRITCRWFRVNAYPA